MSCNICDFRNPKATVTAVIMRDGKVLALKRNQQPFKDYWDLPGGFVNEGEKIEQALRREVKEELGVEITRFEKIGEFPGTYEFDNQILPILSFAFYVQIEGNITINEENHHWEYVPLDVDIAFDSNKSILGVVKEDSEDFITVRNLLLQLDPQARFLEYNFLAAHHNGFVAKEYDGEKLIGFGSIFPRHTILRRQAVVEDMIVDHAYRGKGLGRKILQQLLEWARVHNIEVIELTSHPSRVAANELYKKSGFVLHPTNHYLYKEET